MCQALETAEAPHENDGGSGGIGLDGTAREWWRAGMEITRTSCACAVWVEVRSASVVLLQLWGLVGTRHAS